MSEQEIWKDYTGSIKQFHGLVKISNMGRVYKKGTNTHKNQSGILKNAITAHGYVRVHLSINGKVYNKPVHRMVAEMFIPNPHNKPYVDHINANRSDNRASNLRWVTHSENMNNPIYLDYLRNREFNPIWMNEANKKPCYAENKNGDKLYFESIQELQEHFDTKANIQRKLKNGSYFTSRKSKLYGYRIRLL